MGWTKSEFIVAIKKKLVIWGYYDIVLELTSDFYTFFSAHIFWRRQWQPTPVLLPGESHGRRSLVGCSPWGCEELDMTEGLHFLFSLSCIGEGNGNPLQYSCLENPRDRGAWWAPVYGVAQSRTRLTWLSSSSSVPTSFKVITLCFPLVFEV